MELGGEKAVGGEKRLSLPLVALEKSTQIYTQTIYNKLIKIKISSCNSAILLLGGFGGLVLLGFLRQARLDSLELFV